MKEDKRKYWVEAGVFFGFALLVVLFFREAWFGGQVVQGIDGNYAFRQLMKQQLADGGSGLWGGRYWLGSGSVWPVGTKMFFLRFFPMQWNLTACFSFVMFSALSGMYLFLRRLGLTVWSALFGALAFGFTPHFITLIFPCHIDSVCQMAYVPWLFLMLDITLAKDGVAWRRWCAAIGAGALWGMVLNEDVQRGLYFSVAAAAYGLFRLMPLARPFRLKSLLLNGARLGLAGLIALLAFSNNFNRQFRGALVQGKQAGVESKDQEKKADETWAFCTSWSLYPKELGDSLAPGYHGMISGDAERPYWGDRPVAHSNDSLGFFVLLFGVAGLVAAFRSNRVVRFFSLALILATLLAFGRYMPGKPLFWLWHQLPMMAKMRAPVKFMSVAAFSLSILSAFGIRHLMVSLKEKNRRALMIWLTGFGIVGGGALLWLLGTAGAERVIQAEAMRRVGSAALADKAYGNAVSAVGFMLAFSLLSVGLLAVPVFLKKFRYSAGLVIGGLFVLLLTDLNLIDRYYFKKSLFQPKEFYQADEMVKFLKTNLDGARVCSSLKIIHNGQMIPLPLVANQGMYVTHLFPYHGIEMLDSTPRSRVSQDYTRFFAEHLPSLPAVRSPEALVEQLLDGQIELWRLSNVKYVMTDGALYGMQQPIPVFEAMQRHPALKLVKTGKGLGGRPCALFEVKNALPRFALYAGSEVDLLEDTYTKPEVLERKKNHVRLQVSAAEKTTLAWIQRYDPNWKISIDGKIVEPFVLNGILTGVSVPAGTHDVEMNYRPDGRLLALSLAVVWIGLLCVCAVLVPVGAGRKKEGAAQ